MWISGFAVNIKKNAHLGRRRFLQQIAVDITAALAGSAVKKARSLAAEPPLTAQEKSDPLFPAACLALSGYKTSESTVDYPIAYLQRHFRLPYQRTLSMVTQMEMGGILSRTDVLHRWHIRDVAAMQ